MTAAGVTSVVGEPAVTLVVPCFNEERRLDLDAFGRHLQARPHLGLLMVDDGSTDGTSVCLQTLESRFPDQVAILSLESNMGKGEAVRRGLLESLGRRPMAVGFWDADLAIPLDELDAMLRRLDESPELIAVVGSRSALLADPGTRRRMRRWLGRVASALVHWCLPLEISDTQCGAKLFRCDPVIMAALDEPFLSRWLFDIEMILRIERLCQAPLSRMAAEHPLSRCRDVRSSKIKLSDYARGLVELVRIRLLYGGRAPGKGRSMRRIPG